MYSKIFRQGEDNRHNLKFLLEEIIMTVLFAALLHGAIGIVGFIVLATIFVAFGGKKEKKEAEEAAGCGCLIVIAVLALIIFWGVRNSGW